MKVTYGGKREKKIINKTVKVEVSSEKAETKDNVKSKNIKKKTSGKTDETGKETAGEAKEAVTNG